MGIPVSHLNNKLRKPLDWRLGGRALAKVHLYSQGSLLSDSLSIRKDPHLFVAPHHTPRDTTRDVTSVPCATRRLRRKRRQRAVTSRGETSSSDTDVGASEVSERDIEVYLTESSLEHPANVSIVLSSPCILYQTTPAGVQEELPLQLGVIVTAIFQNQNWVYVRTAHGQEGYVLRKHCLPLCGLPVQKANSHSSRGTVTSWKTYDSILANIADLKRSGGETYEGGIGGFAEECKDYKGCFATVDGLHRTRDPSLTESEQLLLDWNRNQVMSEDVFDHLNGYVNGEGCFYQDNVGRSVPEKGIYRSINCINEILADFVGNERSLTEDARENFETTRCESAFTDGGYYMDDIGVDKEMLGILPNEIFVGIQSSRSSSGKSVDPSNVNVNCKCGTIEYDYDSQIWRNGVKTEIVNARVAQHHNLSGKNRKCKKTPYKHANGVPENCRSDERSNQCVYCFGNGSSQKNSMSESSANISKDFKSPRYSSTPVGNPLYNPNSCHDVRKTKKHCSTQCAHERIQQIEPGVKVPNKSEDKQRNMDDNELKSNEYPQSKHYYQQEKGTHSFSNVDFTSQYTWKPIQKTPPNGNHSCCSKEFESDTGNATGDYKFQTIEILQEPSRREDRTSTADCQSGHRIKKPCFKAHNKVEVSANSAGTLTDIAEDEVEHRADQTTQKNDCQNRDTCNRRSLFKNETLCNQKSKASPITTCDRLTNTELENKGNPTVSTRSTLKNNGSPTFSTRSTLKNKESPAVSTRSTLKNKGSPTDSTRSTLKNKGSPTISTQNTLKDNSDGKTFDTLSTASYPLRRKSTNRTASADSWSLSGERSIDDLFVRRKSRKKLVRDEPVRHKPLMLVTEDYYNEEGRFRVLKDEIVVLLNVYKSWLYVQTYRQENGFIPSYVAAYAVV